MHVKPMEETVLFIAQLKMPPVYEAVIWNGTVQMLQAIGSRYGMYGHIATDLSLILQKGPRTNHKASVLLGEYIVYVKTGNTVEFVEIMSGNTFIKKYSAHPSGSLNIKGTLEHG